MKRIFEDYLMIPAYLRKSTSLSNGNIALLIHVDGFSESMPQRIPDINEHVSPFADVKTYPPVEFQIEVSSRVWEKLEPPNPNREPATWFYPEKWAKRIEDYERDYKDIRHGIAGTIIDLWRKAVGTE